MQKQKERVQVVVDGFVSMIYFQNMKQAIIYVDSSCCGFCQKQDMPLNLYHINMNTRLCFSKPSKRNGLGCHHQIKQLIKSFVKYYYCLFLYVEIGSSCRQLIHKSILLFKTFVRLPYVFQTKMQIVQSFLTYLSNNFDITVL